MTDVLVVEPHADDAMLSVSSVLSNERLTVDVATIFGQVYTRDGGDVYLAPRTSDALIQHFPAVRNVFTLPLESLNAYDRPVLKNLARKLARIKDDAVTFMISEHSQDPEICERYNSTQILNELEKQAPLSSYDFILLPLGLLHPDHVLVKTHLVKAGLPAQLCFYAESPYQFKRYGQRLVESYLQRMVPTLVICNPPAPQKGRTFASLYPTEAGLMRWDHSRIDNNEVLFYPDQKVVGDVVDSNLNNGNWASFATMRNGSPALTYIQGADFDVTQWDATDGM